MSFSRAERRAYNFIEVFLGENDQVSQTFQEIGEALGCTASNVNRLIHQLEKKGHIYRVGTHRSLRLAAGGRMNVYVCRGSINAVVFAPTMPDAWRLLVETIDQDRLDDLAKMTLEQVKFDGIGTIIF